MLKINEIFKSFQGEGKSLGKEVIFVRLAFCSLRCQWCDTPYAWDWKKYNIKDEVHEMDIFQTIEKIKFLETKAIVITGGEPLLQQEDLIGLCRALKHLEYWIEIETNGTIAPFQDLTELVNQFNCSPKMENSGNKLEARYRPAVLSELSENKKTNFKFVVSSKKDIKEILDMVDTFEIKETYLMPEGKTKQELDKHIELVKKLCKENGFKFTNREHIIRFGNKRGV